MCSVFRCFERADGRGELGAAARFSTAFLAIPHIRVSAASKTPPPPPPLPPSFLPPWPRPRPRLVLSFRSLASGFRAPPPPPLCSARCRSPAALPLFLALFFPFSFSGFFCCRMRVSSCLPCYRVSRCSQGDCIK